MPHIDTMRINYQAKDLTVSVKYHKVSDHWLVFLHGLGCAKECFDTVFDSELANKYSLLTFDFVGFGASDKPNDFTYTLEDHVAIAEQVIDYFNPKSVSLIAHSMGGTIGILLSRRLRNLVSLVNVEGNLVSEDASIVSRRTAEQAEEDFIDTGFGEFLNLLLQSDERAYHTWAEWYRKSSKLAIYRSCRSLVAWSDSGKLLPYFNSLPHKLFMRGDKTKNSHLTGQLLKNEIVSIPKSGHFVMLDNPVAFYTAIEKYFMNL